MAYNRENLLRRIVEAQDAFLEQQEKRKGVPSICIYREYIRPNFHISYSTFNRWMGINAKAKLAKIETEKKKGYNN